MSSFLPFLSTRSYSPTTWVLEWYNQRVGLGYHQISTNPCILLYIYHTQEVNFWWIFVLDMQKLLLYSIPLCLLTVFMVTVIFVVRSQMNGFYICSLALCLWLSQSFNAGWFQTHPLYCDKSKNIFPFILENEYEKDRNINLTH